MVDRNDDIGLPLLNEGLSLIQSNNAKEQELGCNKLRGAIESGINEAITILGSFYFENKSFELSEEVYLIGWERKLRVAMYRLALLHGDKLVKEYDEDFYKRTISILAKEGHLPSEARMIRDNIKGKNGIISIFLGILSFLPTSWKVYSEARRNVASWRLER